LRLGIQVYFLLTTWFESEAGWPFEFVKNSPKMEANPFFLVKINTSSICTLVKNCPKLWSISVIFLKTAKENHRPLGENSPNLVTLESEAMVYVAKFVQSGILSTLISISTVHSRKMRKQVGRLQTDGSV
jgi:hypothetical protein